MIFKTDISEFENYLSDASNYKGFADSLYIPENQDELINLVKEFYQNNIKFTISAAGTGLTGGRVPLGGVIISLEKLNKILDFDKFNNSVKIQPCVTLSELEDFLDQFNLFYPPNPTERNSSIGGNIANNSSGARTFKYGFSRNFVKSIKLILPDGDQLFLDRSSKSINNKFSLKTLSGKLLEFNYDTVKFPDIKHSAGYFLKENMDAIDLFIGSEGTLGIISEIELQLLQKPENILGLIIYFDDEQRLLDFVAEIRSKSINSFKSNNDTNSISARLIEYFDHNSLEILKSKYKQIPENAIGAIWIEQEYNIIHEDSILNEWFNTILSFTDLSDFTWTALNDKEHNQMKEFRHDLPLKIFEITLAENHHKIATDTAVPEKYFNQMYYFFKEQLLEYGFKNFVFGHIGNCHLHVNIFPKNENDFAKANEFYEKCINMALDFGGTVSAEHGIGKIKKKYLHMMFKNEGISKMKKIKDYFDPKGLLNSGNMF
jgi:D-lactate dehydrogenase (cytochrome)